MDESAMCVIFVVALIPKSGPLFILVRFWEKKKIMKSKSGRK